MNTTIEKIVLQNLLNDEEYFRKVFPFLKPEYFIDNSEKLVFKKISEFSEKYNSLPNKDALIISLQNDKSLNEEFYNETSRLILELDRTDHNRDWLYSETERFCKDKAIYNAIYSSISTSFKLLLIHSCELLVVSN